MRNAHAHRGGDNCGGHLEAVAVAAILKKTTDLEEMQYQISTMNELVLEIEIELSAVKVMCWSDAIGYETYDGWLRSQGSS